jgi:hypothetical protein
LYETMGDTKVKKAVLAGRLSSPSKLLTTRQVGRVAAVAEREHVGRVVAALVEEGVYRHALPARGEVWTSG